MEYELIYTHEVNKGNKLIGAQVDRVFVPKNSAESDELFLSRLETWIQTALHKHDETH